MAHARHFGGSDPHPWITAALLALVVLLWIGDCSGQEIGPRPGPPTLIETPYAPTGYGRLLADYLLRVSRPDGSVESRFDYARLRASHNQAALRDDLRRHFLSVEPQTLDPATRHAWAVNAYNFLILDAVTESLVSAAGETLASIRDIGDEPFAVFEEERIPLGRETWSLNRFENHFLFHDLDRATGKSREPVDPRYHFLLVCAARGCPPLLSEPLHPEHLERDLEEATRLALRSPHQLRLEGDVLHLSKIFEWYAVDFERPGLRAFLVKYAPDQVGRALSDPKREIRLVTDIEWDWTLNRP